ncbi:hypothetical protein [Acinetobacter larvae]|nr:hypothetical protein [Acinetobacter larvae]
MKNILLILPLLCLTACTSHWVAQDNHAPNLKSSKKLCEILAEEKFPVKNEVAMRTEQKDVYIPCPKKEDCDGKSYTYEKMPQLQSYVLDVNASDRYSSFRQCMADKGWKQKYRMLKTDDFF